jgi:hypothetical protein
MAGQGDPGGHRGARQSCGFLEREVARDVHKRLLAQHRIFRQHAVEVCAEAVGEVLGLDRPAEPTRMKAADDPVANLDPRDALADRKGFTGTVGKRYDAKPGRAAAAALEDHQIAIIE